MKSRSEHWTEHVAAWRESGLSQREYCQQHDLVKGTMSHWVWRLKTLEVEQPMVELLESAKEPAPRDGCTAIELEVAGRYLLRLRPGTDSGHLREVIGVLEER